MGSPDPAHRAGDSDHLTPDSPGSARELKALKVWKLKKIKQEDFYNEHTAKLILFESARKHLKEHLGESKTLNISKWKSELTTLKKDKKSLYSKILEIREEVEQAEKVKTCIEQLQEQEKQLSQVKRNELDL